MNAAKKINFWKGRKILPAITTTPGSNWRDKLKEIKELKLREFCFFPTCLNAEERKEFYKLLEKIEINIIPLVHLRSDMNIQELDYLVSNYKVEVFNIHSQTEFPFLYDYSKYKNIIFIENVYSLLDDKEVKEFGGICLDFAHLENDRKLNKQKFKRVTRIAKEYPIGCNHVSALKKVSRVDEAGHLRYDSHFLEDPSELDYLKKYPANYFASFIALELENSLKDQLEIINYIINLLKEK